MKSSFIVTCESTVDFPYAEVSARNIPVLFYRYMIDGVEYEDDMQRSENAGAEFYARLDHGAKPTTSQLNEFEYTEFLEEQLKKGDVLHITLSSALTKSYENAKRAEAELRAKYPERRLYVCDSLSGCFGYWLLTSRVADMRDAGADIEEAVKWLEENRLRAGNQFFATRMDFFRRSGRVSGPVSTIATLLNIVPLMHLNTKGAIIAYGKAHGKKAAIQHIVNQMLEQVQGGESFDGECFIGHTNCPDLAKQMEAALKGTFSRARTRILNIGNIIACHCGPGTIAVFFMGREARTFQ